MAVVIETTIGDITVDLFIDERPQTCKNFLKLCKIKYYNFCLFHTIQANFIAQTGDPTGIGTGGESVYGIVYGEKSKYYEGEKMPKIKHNKPGLLSMVNYGDNMLGSQFFVTLGAELNSLDEHCVFAEVTEGHDILIKLNDAICDNDNRPFQDIRITHTVILEDPFDDLPGLVIPDASPDISSIQTENGRIGADEKVNDEEGLSETQLQEIKADREAKARATILEIIGDIPYADVAPPENVLFVCKLNPVTTDEDLEVIFGRFGKVKSCEVIRDHQTGDSLQYAFVEFEDQKSCEQAYLKMDNVLIDDRRIHVDFSQSVSKYKWRGKGLGVEYCDKPDEKDNSSSRGSDRHSNKRDYYRDRDRERDRDRSDRSDRRREDDRRRRGIDREEDYRRRERRKIEEPRRRDEEAWREEERWGDDDRKRRDPRDERRRDDDRKYSSRRDERRREEDRRRDIEKRRNGTEKKETSSRRTDNHVEDKKSDSVRNKDAFEKSPKQDPKPECSKHSNGKPESKSKDHEALLNVNQLPKSKEDPVNNVENKVETEENSVSKLSSNLDATANENSTADTITPDKSNLRLKGKKKKRRKMSSSSESSSTESTDSSSSSSSIDTKRRHKRKLTVAKKYYHRGKLVKVIKKKKDDSSDSESSDESSDSDHRRKKRKYKKIVKVIKKRRRTTTDDSDSDSSSSEDSDSSRPRKKKRKSEKVVKKKKKDSKRNKKKKKSEPTDSSASEGNEKYKKKSKNIEAKKQRKEMSD